MPDAFSQNLKTVDLRCEYAVNPLGVEARSPNLSWKLESAKRNILQSGYHILVSDDPLSLAKNIGNIWDSKKVSSNSSLGVAYNGKALSAGKIYYWKIKVWDTKGDTSNWSAAAKWQMGLLTTGDWKSAKWIAYEKLPDSCIDILPADGKKDKAADKEVLPVLRKDFKVNKPIKRATMFISGLGHFEMYVNGKKTGDHFLDPGWTKYDKEALYVTFDLTKELKTGVNAIGIMLGNGFYYIPSVKERYRKLKVAFGYPKMICRLFIEYKDGSSANVISNETWKAAPSAITFSSIYGGEDYDAGREQADWNKPGFNSKAWKNAILVNGPPLNSQKEEPLKVFDHFTARSVTAAGGDWVYDLGQNASGIIELKVKGKKGDTVRIIPAELLNANGTVNQRATGSPYYFQYILKGSGTETWRPRFTYYGFRYLQVKGGVPADRENPHNKAVVVNLEGLHIRNSAATAGSFVSSNELFNRTDSLINWAIKSNMMSVFTDCPHREKLGWLEEAHLMGSSVRYNYDVATLFKKILQDMKNSQTSEGLIPEIAPEYVKFEWGNGMFRDSPEWGSSSILVPWYAYQWFGDVRTLSENYMMMQRYVSYLGTKAKDHILTEGLGDWYDLGPKPPGVSQLTPMGVTGTAIYYYDLTIMEKIALLLGKGNDAAAFNNLAAQVRKAFNNKFFNKNTKQYATGSQTANAMAVYMKLVEPADKKAVVENIIKDIRSKNNSLTAGDIGYRYLLRVLEDEGRSDVIFDMNSRNDVPGYGYQLAKGATALTESWAALPSVSNNHFMLGHIMEWFYSGLGGIRQENNSIAFKEIKICPEPVGDLSFVKTTYESPYGLIATDWKKNPDSFELNVTVPANTKANIYLPAGKNQVITESGVSVKTSKDIIEKRLENGKTVLSVGSGSYKFKVQ